MAKNNLINNSTDSITRKKMYKSGKNWVVATLTAASLTGMVLVSNLKVADADSVTPTSPSTGSSSTTSSDKSATYSVTVDHSQLDNSVKQAQSTGVQVKQNPTTSTVVDASEASKAVDNISQNYQQQTNEVKQATERQTVKNETYAKDVVDANSTNAANKAKIDEAVKNLQNAGGRASHNSSKDSTVKANIDNYSDKKNEVNTSVNAVVKQIQDATDKANANNVVSGAVANKSDFNKAVQNAKDVLGSNNVIQDKAVNHGKVTPSNSSSISQEIKNDYAKQVTSINTTVKQYQDAVNAAGAISKDELENAVKNAQNILGKNNVSQDPTVTKTTTVGNTKATVDEVNQDYKSQVTNINNKVKQYQDAKQAISSINNSNLDSAIRNAQSTPGVKLIDDGTRNVTVDVNNYNSKKAEIERDNKQQADSINSQVQQYKQKLDEYKKTLAKGEIATTDIYNSLHLQNEPEANMTWRVLNNSGNVTRINPEVNNEKSRIEFTQNGNGDINGDFLEVTMSNLQGSDYKGVKLGKIVLTFSNAKHATVSTLKNASMTLDVHSNIVNGMHYRNMLSLQTTMKLYDKNGTLIELGNDNSAWVAIKSLNAIYWKDGSLRNVEEVRLDSSGTGYKLKGSVIVKHSDGFWYSDETTDHYGIPENELGKINHIPYGTPWDGNPNLEYMGSTLFNVTGNKVTLTFKNIDTVRSTDFRPGADKGMAVAGPWVVISTSIMKDSSGIVPPTIHYQHTNVELQQPEAIHYHLDSVTVEKPTVHYHENSFTPGDTNVVPFSYTNISVDTPTPETASYNYSDLLVKHKTTKSDSVKANNTDVKMDGKTVVAGSKLTYKIETDDFQASTGTTTATRKPTKSYVIVDKLPDGTTPDINEITVVNTATKQDLTKNFTIAFDNATNTVRLEANDALIKMINADLTKTYPKLEQNLPVTVTGKVINLNNRAKTIIDGIETGSNIVTNEVTTSTPEKTVNIGNNNADGKYSITNDTQKYVVTVDYSRFANVIVSDDIAKKELSFTDNMIDKNNVAQLNTDSIKLLDKSGKAVDSNLYTPTVTKTTTGYSIKFTIKDPVKFIKAYGGQKLNLEYTVRTRDGVTGDVLNNIIQNNFDVIYSGNTTTVHVIDINPKKDVVSSIGSTESLNGKTVPINSVIYYRLDSSNLPANRATNVNSWSFKDPLDTKVVATGDVHILANGDLSSDSISIKKNDDITKYFNINYDKGVYTISPTDEYKSLTNKTTDKANSYSIYIGAKVVKAGWAVNTATEELNGDNDKTNEVKTFSFDPVNPDPKKDASIGHNDNKDIISINGMGVTKGDTISYQLKGQPLVKYHETINKFSAVDRFDEGIKYEGYHAYLFTKDGKQIDVTDMLSQQIDGNTVQWAAKDALLKLMNSDEYNTKESVTPTIIAYAKVTADGIKNIENTYTLYINGKTDISNIVTNHTNDYKPGKSETVAGNDSDGKTVITNDKVKFDVAIDLKGLNQNTAISDDQLSKGIYVVDRLQDKNHVIKALAPEIEMQLTDSKGNVIKEWSGYFGENETKDQHVINLTLGEKGKLRDFLKKYGGQVLHLTYYAFVEDGKSGDITNQVTVTIFGNNYSTNVTKNTVKDINPHKDIVVNAGDTTSIDGSTVPLNSTYNYKLKAQELPTNRATIVTDWVQTDKLDLVHVQPTNQWKVYTNTDFTDKDGRTVKAGTDISTLFEYNYKDGVVTITPKIDYINLVNNAKNRLTSQSFSSYVQVKVIKAGWVYNTFVDALNDDSDTSNKVKTFSFDPIIPNPNKDGAIGETTSTKTVSVNGKRVTKGDTVTYILKGQPLVQYHEQVKTFSAVDVFDKGLDYKNFKAMMNQKDGKQIDVTDHIKAQVDGNTVTFVADDVLTKMMNSDAYNTVPGVTPTIYAYAVVNTDNVRDKIDNSYWLNINGKQDVSNIIEVTPATSNPEKHENVAGNDANGKTVTTNDVLNYDVNWDLSQLDLKGTAISDKQLAKGLSIDDTLTTSVKNGISLNDNSLQIRDAKGNTINKDLYTLTVTKNDTGFKFTIKVKDAKKFLETYGGQKLSISYNVKVLDGVNGQISNIAVQNNFGQSYKTETIKNEIKNINPHKDIVVNAGDTTSIDGSTVPLNSTYNYKLESSDLSDNRATVANKWSVNDKIDVEHVATTNQWKVLARYDLVGKDGKTIKAGTDISTLFDYNYKDGVVTITPKVDYLTLVNNDKNRATKQGWDAYVQVKVIKAGWVSNTFNENFNDDEDKSNEVKTFSFDPINPKGDKDVNSGEVSDNLDKQVSINGKQVVPGDTVSFQLKGQPLVPYHETVKEFKAEDTLSEGLEYLGYKAFIVGDDGKQVDVTSMIKATKSDKTVTYIGTEELNKLLNSDEYNTKASKTPTIVLYAKVAKYFSGKIDNNYKLYINGKSDISNTVEIENKTPNPVKDDKNEDGVDINGKSIPRNSTNVFYLHWNASQYKDAIATKDAIQKGFYYVDDYPDDALQAPAEFDIKDDTTGKSVDGFTTMNYASLEDAPKEIQDMLKANGIEVKGAFVVISANDPQKFFDTYVKAGHNLTIELPLKLRDDFKVGSYKNRAFEIDFGEGYPTNEVENTVIKTTPDKDVVDDNGKSVKDKYVTAGDIMHYVGTWDLTGYKNFALTKGQIAKGLSIFDDYDENVLEVSDLNKQALTIIDSTDNKAIDMSMVEINWDDAHGKWTISAKDPQNFLETYGGRALKINFFAKVKKDAKGDIKNTIVQNDFGNETETDVVTNHISVSDPLKDVVVSLTDNHSLNNGVVKLGDTLYYKLGSKTREANEAYNTTSWGFVDKLDITHDLYTGQALVKARYDIKLKDGSTIKAGDDITKYFDITYDAQTGEFKVMANKEFLDIINSDDNKATKQGFDVYLQAKRIKSGDVENTAQEIYNGEVINTNTVTTHTDEPEEPKSEIPQVPEVPNTPSTPQKTVQTSTKVTPTPAIEKATVLPQTGDSKDSTLAEVGLLAVALAGGIGLAGYKKKKTE
ncbi:LPXTG cell wall anchor domain-containing protein [Campylobacter jejuni]